MSDRETWLQNPAARPWRDLPEADLARAFAVPGMLSREEGLLYHWLGRTARGEGATIDLGAFAGGSAARLLSGLERSGAPFHLHAYDRFTARRETRERRLYPHGVPRSDSDDILPLVQAHLAPWQDHVTLHRGDILQARWDGAPAGLVAVDAAKTPALADHIAATFFPALVPGRSIVIQQDFLHAPQPWIAVQMARLQGAFRPLAQVAADCVLFLCTAPVSADALRAARTEGLDDASLIAGLAEAADLFAPLLPRERFRAMVRKLRANPGVRVAWQMRNG
jgi:hypothetical protein